MSYEEDEYYEDLMAACERVAAILDYHGDITQEELENIAWDWDVSPIDVWNEIDWYY